MASLASLWAPRWVRRTTWTLAIIFTGIALFYAWVDWSGARLWEKVRTAFENGGERFELRDLAADPIADADNFCGIPALKDLSLTRDGTSRELPEKRKRMETLALPEKTRQRPSIGYGATVGRRVDMQAWANWLRKDGTLPMPAKPGDAAHDVLAALSGQDELIGELASGLDRSGAQWTPALKTRELPRPLLSLPLRNIGKSIGIANSLALRSVAEVRAGDVPKAHESLRITMRLAEATMHEPFLVTLMIASVHTDQAASATWEMCDAHAGSAEDFRKLELAFARMDYRDALVRAWRGEISIAVDALMFVKETRERDFMRVIDPNRQPGAFAGFVIWTLPSGFFDANAVALTEWEHRRLVKPLREEGWGPMIASAQEAERELHIFKPQVWKHPSNLSLVFFAPAGVTVARKLAHAQCLADQAAIACALERYRIEHGQYPDSLDAVKLADGRPLPLDLASGKPMRYRRTDDGRYALWSIGLDGQDDDGKRGLDQQNPEFTRFFDVNYRGDWVWDFAGER